MTTTDLPAATKPTSAESAAWTSFERKAKSFPIWRLLCQDSNLMEQYAQAWLARRRKVYSVPGTSRPLTILEDETGRFGALGDGNVCLEVADTLRGLLGALAKSHAHRLIYTTRYGQILVAQAYLDYLDYEASFDVVLEERINRARTLVRFKAADDTCLQDAKNWASALSDGLFSPTAVVFVGPTITVPA